MEEMIRGVLRDVLSMAIRSNWERFWRSLTIILYRQSTSRSRDIDFSYETRCQVRLQMVT